MNPDNTSQKQAGRWQPGESGNPDGRPRGSRNKTTLAAEALLEGEAEAITRKAIELAKAGDLTAIRICLDRTAPARRDRHVAFELPKIETPEDAVKACAALLEAVAAGDLTPSEAAELGKLVDACARSIEATEFGKRLSRIEERVGK